MIKAKRLKLYSDKKDITLIEFINHEMENTQIASECIIQLDALQEILQKQIALQKEINK